MMKDSASVQTHTSLRWNAIRFMLYAALAVTMPCLSAFAQSGAGSIQGTVTDSTGAVMPGASIHVVNQSTAEASDSTTNSVGFYQVPGLFTGTYVVTVTAPGMTSNQRTIELQVGQTMVINPSLTAGSVTQKVEVSADTFQLTTTDSGAISTTLENSRINQLPMNGRSILTLTGETSPGLESCSQSQSCPNGLMGEAMEYVADGVSLSNREFGGTHEGSNQMPDPDSIQEVRVETNGSGAQFATPAAGVITTKSGTNQLHGTLFETARNNYFGIARSRSNPSNYVAPHYVRNEFGISLGGPVILPHIYNGKNKTFWFFAYERYSLASFSYLNMTVPTLAMKQGDFSGLTNSSNVLQQLYDPATTASSPSCANSGANGAAAANPYCRTPFANNQIPVSRESPTAKIFMDITPLPTYPNINPMVGSNLAGISPNNQIVPTITFRIDHQFDENNRVYLRYTSTLSTSTTLRNDPSNEPASLAADGLPAAASGIAYDPNALFAAAIGYTHIFSPSFYAETIVSQQWFGEQNYAGGTPFADFEQQLGLPNNFGEVGFPYVESIFSPLDGTQFQYGLTQIIDNLDENLSKTAGRHQMFFGGRFRHERFGSRPDEIKDSINFGAYATALNNPALKPTSPGAIPNTGNANADEFLGAASSYGVNIEPPYEHFHDNEFDLYFQDNYHVARNLTLNLGLRYEAHPAVWEKYGMMMSFDLKNDAVVTAVPPSKLIAEGYTTQAIITNDQNDGVKFETPEAAGMPANTLIRNYNFTFGPRFGIAYQPFPDRWGTVLRGAYGRYIYPEPIRSSLNSINRNNPFTAGYSESYTGANQSPDGLPDYLMRSRQQVVMGVNSANVVNSNTTNSILPGISIYSINPDFPPNYVTQTNFTIEQPMKGNSVLRLSYLYTHGTNLDQDYFYNNHPSTYVWEMQTGIVPPNGSVIGSNQYSATATGPYDQVTYGGGNYILQKSGWSNYNGLQANYQKLFHHGIAYQVSYVWAKAMRVGGNWDRDSEIDPYQNYVTSGLGVMTPYLSTNVIAPDLPPPPPSNAPSYAYYRALNRFANYMVDTAIPKQHIQFNGIVELPFGQGKRFFGSVNRFVNELIGGYQIAGSGSVSSQDFAITATNWGSTNPIKVYKHKAPITDCRSGTCFKEYEWFNGYIAPTAISGNMCAGALTTVVSGLPSGWAPYQGPSDQLCGSPVNGKVSTDTYYGSNEVNVLASGKVSPLAYQPYPTSNNSSGIGSNPFSHTVLNGPMNYVVNLSLFKVFPITERVNLRVNVDAFNAFNVQGFNNPNATDGTEAFEPGASNSSSYNTPRQIQLTARLTF
jgi:hypothetical protein